MQYWAYALAASTLLAAGNIIQKQASKDYTQFHEFYRDTFWPNIIFGIAFLIAGAKTTKITIKPLLFLAIASLFSAILSRLLFQKAVHLDSSSSAAVGSTSTQPLFTALLGATVFDEKITPKILTATALIIASAVIMNRDKKILKKAYAYGALAGITAAIGATIVKISYASTVTPTFAAGFFLTTSALAAAIIPAVQTRTITPPKPHAKLFLAYTSFSIARLSMYKAYQTGYISTTTLLVLTYPLFIILISLLLKIQDEKITPRKTASAILTITSISIILT